MMKSLFTGLLALAFVCTSAASDGALMHANPATSRLAFSAWYESEQLPGRFNAFTVEVRRSPDHGNPTFLRVVVDMASADMNDADINDELKQADWFDTTAFPQAVFVSDTITENGRSGFTARGTLKLKGISLDLDVPFDWEATDDGAVMRGRLSLSRLAWQVGMGEWEKDETIADEVGLEFNVELLAADS